jgi:hypothetical protein
MFCVSNIQVQVLRNRKHIFLIKPPSISNKPYLANGGQQDMEEFRKIFLAELRREVDDDEGLFFSIIENFWGQEVTVRKFVDTPNGRCVACHLYPS